MVSGSAGSSATSFRPKAGSVIGRYRIEGSLGSGGMARVFRVRDVQSDRALALKLLSTEPDRKQIALFEREYYTLASLRHPNIVEVHDYASHEGRPYYTMELLHGGDVSALAPRPWPEVCRVLRDVASALALLHARRYLHRDVSARNVWLTLEAKIKLIDFGTLMPFGKSTEVAGTPPFVAPESLYGHELDQRTDLYALGALGYWLLTGLHAFGARSLFTLDELWKQRPRAPSHRVAELEREDLPAIPLALDALLERLLSIDARVRPSSASEVIDALSAIDGLPGEAQVLEQDSYLQSPALVGRVSENALLQKAFDRARESEGVSLFVEGPPGIGRTRLLSEFALRARMALGVVLQVGADGRLSTQSVAEQFARKLLQVLPSAAKSAAQPYAATLGHISPTLREQLGIAANDLAELPRAHGEVRMRLQGALSEWFLELAREHTLVLIADDIQDCDPWTVSWLAALGREGRHRRLAIVVAQRSDAATSTHIDGMRALATVLPLGALESNEISAIVTSVFGEAQHVARVAELVAQRAEGNPGRTLELVKHLVQQGVASYAEGAWMLPTIIAEEQLPNDAEALSLARLRRLTEPARALGRALSVCEGSIDFDLSTALAETSTSATYAALEDLVRAGVLAGSSEGYRFGSEPIRKLLLRELDDARKLRVHRICGEALLDKPALTELERLNAGVQLLRGGDIERGTIEVARAAKHYGLVDLADVGPAAPALESALELFIQHGRPAHEQLTIYAPLALAGYYAERVYFDRYADRTIALMQTLLGLNRARTLRRYLGAKLGVLISLGLSTLRFHQLRKNPRVASFREAVMLLFNCVACATGVSAICIDSKGAARYADVLEPMRALGHNHIASLMHDFCLNLATTVQDRVDLARTRWQVMIERLDSAQPMADLTDDVRELYLAGALYACGVMECWRDTSKALQFAQRLEDFKLKLYELTANQIRMLYYAHQGNVELAEHYRERVEVHAIQRGTAWQVETWTFTAMLTVHLRTHNVIGMKHCVDQMRRLSREIPSLRTYLDRSTGVYLLLRGSPEQALPFFGNDEPLASVGWGRIEGTRARALNSIAAHSAAREVCLRALSHLAPADLDFAGMNLSVEIELALAECGLGRHLLAAEQLDALLKKHQPFGGPLTLGELHEARAQVAVAMRDAAGLEFHLACLERWYRATNDRPLIARGERFARAARQKAIGTTETSTNTPGAEVEHPLTVVHRLRHGGASSLEGSAEWILDQLLEYADVRAGHVYLWTDDRISCVASRGDLPASDAFDTAVSGLMAVDSDTTTTTMKVTTQDRNRDRVVVRGRSYRLLRLVTSPSSGAQLVGALLLSEETLFTIPKSVLRVIADRIYGTQTSSLPLR